MRWRDPNWMFVTMGVLGLVLAAFNFYDRNEPSRWIVHRYVWIIWLIYSLIFFWRAVAPATSEGSD